MDEITAIELLGKVLLGEKKATLPPNGVQLRKSKQQQLLPQRSAAIPMTPAQPEANHRITPSKPDTNANYLSDDDDDALPDLNANYTDSDDKEDEMEDAPIHPRARRSKHVMQ